LRSSPYNEATGAQRELPPVGHHVLLQENVMRRKSSFRVDMTGQRVGRLVVVEFAGTCRDGALWLCQCDCGEMVVRQRTTLKLARSKSCGCIGRESRATRGGESARSHVEYVCWRAMIARCEQRNHPNYRYYGGRGITVCERWRASFDDFVADMGPRPSAAHSVERNNNDGNYEPSNCRWATKIEQMRNRRHCPTCTCLSNPF
jgi:hypothetical protein